MYKIAIAVSDKDVPNDWAQTIAIFILANVSGRPSDVDFIRVDGAVAEIGQQMNHTCSDLLSLMESRITYGAADALFDLESCTYVNNRMCAVSSKDMHEPYTESGNIFTFDPRFMWDWYGPRAIRNCLSVFNVAYDRSTISAAEYFCHVSMRDSLSGLLSVDGSILKKCNKSICHISQPFEEVVGHSVSLAHAMLVNEITSTACTFITATQHFNDTLNGGHNVRNHNE